jgi:hypothetical protein
MMINTIFSGINGQKLHFSLFLKHFEGNYQKATISFFFFVKYTCSVEKRLIIKNLLAVNLSHRLVENAMNKIWIKISFRDYELPFLSF